MTGEHDMDDVPEHLIPEEQVEAILSGEDLGVDLSELLAPVAALLQRAQQPPSPVEQLEASAAISTIVEVRRAASDELASRRTRMLPAFSKRTAAIVVGVTLWSTIGVAAATGNLPLGISGGDTSGQSSLQELADDTTTTTEATTTTTEATTTEATTSTSEVTTTTEATTTTGEATTTTSEATTTTTATSTTAATSTTGATVASAATSLAARGVGPDPNGPAKSGLCNAYLKGLANGKPKNPNAPPWRNLLQAAGDGGVEEFCGVTTTAAAPPTTSPATTTATTEATTTVAAAAAVVHGQGNGHGNGHGTATATRPAVRQRAERVTTRATSSEVIGLVHAERSPVAVLV